MITGAQLRKLALGLPGTQERETWGHPTFRVDGKIFVGLADDGCSATVKTSPQEQAQLVGGDPTTFDVAPRVGRFGWVTVQLDRVDPGEIRELVVEAWRRTAPKKAVADYDARTA